MIEDENVEYYFEGTKACDPTTAPVYDYEAERKAQLEYQKRDFLTSFVLKHSFDFASPKTAAEAALEAWEIIVS